MGQRLKFVIVFWAFLWVPWRAFAFPIASEQDTLRVKPLVLTEVTVRTFRISRTMDSVWLKTMPLASLADVMGMLGTPVTRQSVPGGLSTLSYRGGGATHNDLTWGDFSLNHPMNRTADLQLVPVWLFQGLGLDNGGEALRTGGYGMGGGIGLGSLTSPPFEAVVSAGTLGDQSLGCGFALGQGRWQGTTRGLLTRNANRFGYPNRALAGAPDAKMLGADFGQEALVHQSNWKGRAGHAFETSLWLQGSRRGIPSSMTSRPGSARQNDSMLRVQAKWSWQKNRRWNYWTALAFQKDLNRYTDTLSGVYGFHQTQGMQARGGVDYQRRGWRVRFMGLWDRHEARSSQYLAPVQQERWALIMPWNLHRGPFEFSGQIKAETLDGKGLPLAANLRARYVQRNSFWWAEVRTAVNPPSLNDRLWVPGGRPDLKPERSRQAEGGYQHLVVHGKHKIDATILAFWREMRERILWQPSPNTAWWSPMNVGLNQSLGTEVRIQGSVQSWVLRGLTWTWQAEYGLQRVWSEGDNRLRIQWPYIPQHRGMLQSALAYGCWTLFGQVQGISSRNTLSDGSETLPAYALVTAAASFEKRGHRISLQIRNLTNTRYEEVPWFPRPGRSFHLSLSTSLFKSPKRLKSPQL